MYICVWFELKFSTGQVTPKPDCLVENWTPGKWQPYQWMVVF